MRSSSSLPGALAALFALLISARAQADSDPRLEWWTLETAHFRVHYYKGLEPAAEKVATLAEAVNGRLSEIMGWRSTEVTHVVLSDASDDANGSATATPYNTVNLYVTAPDDISPLADYDDWFLELVTHEYTHVLHTDNVTGVPALVNRLSGKRWVPNQAQPRWVLEGLAVLHESVHTGGGRNRSSIFDMYLRGDVLDHRLAGLDQMSHQVRRWPQANIWYLYGSRFLTWITDVYGPGALRATAHDYGRQIVPWGLNRSMRRATGRTYEELYQGWTAHLEDHYRSQLAEVSARGVREGTRLTYRGETVASPRFVPASARRGPGEELLYFRSDGHDRPGYYQRPLVADSAASPANERLVARANGRGTAAYSDEGRLVFSAVAISNHLYAFNDLFTLPPASTAPSGWEPERIRLTVGERAQEPDVSRDGSAVVFTENHRGTTTLMIGALHSDGTCTDVRALVASARYEQAYTPRFSADGKRVTYSAWTAGGYRDVRVVDVASGQFVELLHDRAMDWHPMFTSDGRYVLFASDRTLGIPNIFAYDLAAHKLWQVTNVKTGALYPAVSDDNQRLAYVGYTSFGHDLFSMPFDPSTWLEPIPYADTRPDMPAVPADAGVILERHRYDALPTLGPRSWDFDYGPGPFGGTALSLTTRGSDVVGHHAFAASMLVDSERAELQGSLSYAYTRLPFDMRTTLWRSVDALRGASGDPTFYRPTVSATSGLVYTMPGEFESTSINMSYTISRFDGSVPLSSRPDPYAEVRREPTRGQVGAVHLGWGYSNTETYLHSVGPERGLTLSLGVDLADPVLASDYQYGVFAYSATGYVPMPWARHHTVAVHAQSGLSAGNNPRAFSTGGFLERPLFESFTLGAHQSPFVLRGYPATAFSGTQFHLFNLEYRFPLLNVDHGVSTLPAFLHRLNGNVFADYGGAFNAESTGRRLHLGLGVELWAELTLAYFVSAHLRVGYALGIDDSRATHGGQLYVALAVPF